MKKITVSILVLALFSSAWINAQTEFKLLETVSDHNSPVEVITMCPDGQTMITAHHDGFIVSWDLKTRKKLNEQKIHSGMINSAFFDASGKQFITAGEDGKVAFVEFPSLKVVKAYSVPVEANAFAVSTIDQSYLYFGGFTRSRTKDESRQTYNKPLGALYRINLKTGDKPEMAYNDERPNEYGSRITDGALDYTGKYIIYAKDATLYFYNTTDRRLEYKIKLDFMLNNIASTSQGLYVWADMQLIKLEGAGNRYAVVKTVTGGSRPSHRGYSRMVLSANGKMLVTGDDGNDVNIWSNNLDKLQTLTGHSGAVRSFLFYNNDSILVTGGYDGNLMYWGFDKPPVTDTVPEIKDVVFAENNIPVAIKDRSVELQSTITVTKPEFDMEIWDRSVVDGDSISLNLNGEWILQEYMVVKSKLKIHVKINPNAANNYLILFAHNLGTISPNTAAVQVLIDGKEYRLTLTSDLNKSGALNFSYKPQ